MKFKHGTVDCIFNSSEGCIIIETDGWIDERNEFGYCKVNAKLWKAIDLETGTEVCARATRKECAAWVEENLDTIRTHPNRAKWKAIKEKAPVKEEI